MSFLDRFFGRGQHAITVPALDGAFRPNDALDQAQVLAQDQGLGAICRVASGVIYSTGGDVRVLGQPDPVARFDHDVVFLTPDGDGALAGLANGDLARLNAEGAKTGDLIKTALPCLTAGLVLADGGVVLANGSADTAAQDWPRDLLNKGRSGSVVRVDPSTGSLKVLAKGLSWPAGLAQSGDRIVVAEAWQSRLVTLPLSGGGTTEVLGNLPGYPGTLLADGDGFWLALFAPRSQLIEFVLREDAFRRAMMAEVAPEHWIAPSLRSGRGFLEPLQAGSVKQLGVLKPWAPTRSFGLVARLDAQFIPQASYHSRADGNRHGVTGLAIDDARLLFVAKGDGLIGQIEPEDMA